MKYRIVSRRGAAWRLDIQTGAGCHAGLCSSTSRLALIALLGAGASSLAFSASAANFNANNSSDLANAINRAANGDTITFTSNITLGSNLPAVTKNITIEGNGGTLSGQNLYRGFIVGDPFNPSKPTVAINNLTIVNALAMGGKAALRTFTTAGTGGGGAGLGGALLVLAGANVTTTNVTFQNGNAQGGDGALSFDNPFSSVGGGGGGGYLTSGKISNGAGYGGHGGLGGGGDGGNNKSGDLAQPGGFGGGGGGQGRGRNAPGGAGGFGGGGGGNPYHTPPFANSRGGFGAADGNGKLGGGAVWAEPFLCSKGAPSL